ncbi:arginase family protein [Massilia sp. W12]|uniref:arginase family protein n=1 Tax=Massilia sp. W12 TaxID=3126507 RepID=UPI0030CAC73C
MNTTLSPLLQTLSQCLCPPGEGVYTVHTGRERRNALQEKLFGAAALANGQVRQAWLDGLQANLAQASCAVLGIASDCGGGIQRGANWGPLFLRSAMLQAQDMPQALDLGDVRVIPHLLHDKYLNTETLAACRAALYPTLSAEAAADLPVAPLSIAERVAHDVQQALPHLKLFMIGGDHSVSYPMVRTWLAARQAGGRAALIHFDAHTDLLQTRLGIDLCFGTWTSQIFPWLASPQHLVQIGIRASGRERGHWESTFGHVQYWSEETRQLGAAQQAAQICAHLHKLGVEEIYISYDIDCLDQSLAGATGTPEDGGMTVEESLQIIQALCAQFTLSGADIVEIAPMVKAPGVAQNEPETTLASACALARPMLQAMGA